MSELSTANKVLNELAEHIPIALHSELLKMRELRPTAFTDMVMWLAFGSEPGDLMTKYIAEGRLAALLVHFQDIKLIHHLCRLVSVLPSGSTGKEDVRAEWARDGALLRHRKDELLGGGDDLDEDIEDEDSGGDEVTDEVTDDLSDILGK